MIELSPVEVYNDRYEKEGMKGIIKLIHVWPVSFPFFITQTEYPLVSVWGRCASHRSCLVDQDLRSFILEE